MTQGLRHAPGQIELGSKNMTEEIQESNREHDAFGESILKELESAIRFSEWMYDTIEPFLGNRILEIGSGIGNISRQLPVREKLTLTDYAPEYREMLRSTFGNNPAIDVRKVDLTAETDFVDLKAQYDSVICLNVLEHIEDDEGALRRMRSLLAPGGRLIILVPQYMLLMSEMDRLLGHYRRYSKQELRRKLTDIGLISVEIQNFNFLGSMGWFVSNTLGGNQSFGSKKITLFDMTVPIMKPIESWVPLPGLSVIGIGTVPSAGEH
jgi:2-polyprenyl-3-methyl-5-hydroxy-6-metoxy-1,4-benzoquinol methylase